MWDDKGEHELAHGREVVETLKTQPEALGSRLSVAFSAQEATQLRCHAGGFTQRRRLVGFREFARPVYHEGLPFVVREEDCAWYIRCFSTELGRMMDAPCHYHVNGQTRLYTVGCA
jgi:hypothetical protein